jgi:hypothetical protein
MDVISVDRTTAAVSTLAATAEIATLRQKLAAAEPRVRENTDRGPIKGGAGRRMVDGKNFRLADDVRYIQRRAAKHDGRVVIIGQLVLFSTETGDAWLLEPSDQLAARLARNGDPEPFHIEENETTFTIEWKGRYRIEGTAFVYMDRETDTIHGLRSSQGGREDRGVSRTRCDAQSEARVMRRWNASPASRPGSAPLRAWDGRRRALSSPPWSPGRGGRSPAGGPPAPPSPAR